MAARVEATAGEMSPSGPLINPDKPTVSASALSGDAGKPGLGPKPHLMPKPFALQRNATIRPISAPKTNFARQLPRALSSDKLNSVNSAKPASGDTKACASINKNSNSTSNGSSKTTAPKLAPKPDVIPKYSVKHPDVTGSDNNTGPNAKPDVIATPKQTQRDILAEEKKVQLRSRTKSLGAQDQKVHDHKAEGELIANETVKDQNLSPTCWPPRNRLSVELTSRFETPPQPEMELNSVRRDSESNKTDKERAVISPSVASEVTSKTPEPQVEKEEVGDEEISGSSIKRRISLLFDRTTAAQRRSTINKRDDTPVEISVDIKQRIKNLSLDPPEKNTRLPSNGALKRPAFERTPSNSDESPSNGTLSEKPAEPTPVQNGSHRPARQLSSDKPSDLTEVQPAQRVEQQNGDHSKPDVRRRAEDTPTANSETEKNALLEDRSSTLYSAHPANVEESSEEEEMDEEGDDVKEYMETSVVPLYRRVGIAKDVETKRQEEEDKRRQAEEERRLEEEKQKQLENERKQEEEKQRLIEERRKQEENRKKRLEEEIKQQEERERQLKEERRRTEEREKERQREEERLRLEKEREIEQERLRQEREKEKLKEEMEKERRRIEEEKQKEEERLRQEREKERMRKEREMEERRRIEEEKKKEEERLKKEKEMEEERRRIQEMERQKEEERLRKEREMEEERKRIEEEKKKEEKLRQEREKERIRKEKEMEDERKRIEKEKQKEEERLKKEKEMEEERRRIQEMERQKEEERLRQEKERIRKEREMEERRIQEEMERQKEEERLRQEREMERLKKEREMEEERRRIQEIERQKEEERLRQEREKERLKKEREMEEERRRIEEERKKEEERLRLEREKERIRKEKEMEEERRRIQEMERQKEEEERLRQERLKKEREMEEERRRIQEMERQKEEERQRQEREKERLRKEREMEEERRRIQEMERKREEERLRQEQENEREMERIRLEEDREWQRFLQEKERTRQVNEERRKETEETERTKAELSDRMEEPKRETERQQEVERLRQEVPTSYDLISFDSEEPARPQSLVSAVHTKDVSPPSKDVIFDDFSVKPLRWGTQTRTPSPPRDPAADLKPESRSRDPGSQRLNGDQVTCEKLTPEAERSPDLLKSSEPPKILPRTSLEESQSEPEDLSEPEPESSQPQHDEVTSHKIQGQLNDCALEDDAAAEQDTETLIRETESGTESPSDTKDAVDGPGEHSKVTRALQRLRSQRITAAESERPQASAEEEPEPLPFPESSTPLLDSSVLRSKADLGKKRSIKRSRPSRSVRHKATMSPLTEGTAPDWRFCDSTDAKSQCIKEGDSESEEEQQSKDTTSSPAPSQAKRVPLFPGMDQSALMAQLKRRSGAVEADSPTEGQTSPSVATRSPRTHSMTLGPRVLPPIPSKDQSGGTSSPSWLLELKSKKRMSQPESEA